MNILGLNPPSKYSKNVARDLLWGCWCKGRRIAGVQFPPLPLMYVGTVLKKEGFSVDVLDAQGEHRHPLAQTENLLILCHRRETTLLLVPTEMSDDARLLRQVQRSFLRLKRNHPCWNQAPRLRVRPLVGFEIVLFSYCFFYKIEINCFQMVRPNP